MLFERLRIKGSNGKAKNAWARSVRRLDLILVALLWIGLACVKDVEAEQVRVAMPSRTMGFMNFYVGEKFGIYSAEGLDVSFSVMKADITVAAAVTGEIDYITAVGTAIHAAATGVPVKATMFTMDKVIFFLVAKPEIKTIHDLKGGKAVAVAALVGADAVAVQAMARAQGLNPEKDFTFVATGSGANVLAALQGGSVVAGVLPLPFNFRAEAMGFRNLGNTVEYVKAPSNGLGTSNAKLRSNPEQVRRMIRATLKTLDFTTAPANQDQVIAYMMEDFKIDRKTAELSHREIIKAFTKNGTLPDEAVEAQIELSRIQANIKGRVPIGQVMDYTLLKDVLAETKR
jgi:NitT/TauT family transport system substrate-binding protein